ncbi:MAG: heavy-metal-associated domain-containing protein, partial [Candidatus Caldipriscus sp.]
MKKVILKVKGMNCMECTEKVRKAIEKEGGREVKVSLEEGKAEFSVEEGNLQNILRSLEMLGYPADVEQIIG